MTTTQYNKLTKKQQEIKDYLYRTSKVLNAMQMLLPADMFHISALLNDAIASTDILLEEVVPDLGLAIDEIPPTKE